MNPPSVLEPAGPVAQVAADISWVLIIGAALVFVLVLLLLGWALWHRGPRPRPRQAGSTRGQRAWLLGGGLLLPVVVLASLLVFAQARMAPLWPPREPAEPVITVIAHLWWWEVRYHDPARGLTVVEANQIHLPTGRTVTLGLTSADVIHSFWVPALAGKVDMLPGRVHQLRLQAGRAGVFRGQCAEYCGEQHARMALHVVAQEPADFERWLALRAQPAATPALPLAHSGLQVFLTQRCNACHNVSGLAPGPNLGPDLTHLGSRLHIAAGTLPLTPQALRAWVTQPQHAKPGARMPDYTRLDDASMTALVAFLEQLR